LPVIFVCENNLYGISVSQARHQNISDVADRANAYDIPGVVVDGNDIMAVYEAAGEAIKRARAGKGPSLIECKTYRWRGHFEGDPTAYRPKSELEAWMKKDPIPRFEAALKEMGVITDTGIAATKKDIGEKVEAAVKFSEESDWPALSEILDDVYTGDPVAV
jgi:pyruvate dehydrogenase E1 component alpha subunit